jgi:hypothetical protein
MERNVLFGIWILARLHVAAAEELSCLGIKLDDDASAKRALNVESTFASLMSTVGAVDARMGLKAARSANEVLRNMFDGEEDGCMACMVVKGPNPLCSRWNVYTAKLFRLIRWLVSSLQVVSRLFVSARKRFGTFLH